MGFLSKPGNKLVKSQAGAGGCDDHWDCNNQQYCDEWTQCWDLDECEFWDDPIDGNCPWELRQAKTFAPEGGATALIQEGGDDEHDGPRDGPRDGGDGDGHGDGPMDGGDDKVLVAGPPQSPKGPPQGNGRKLMVKNTDGAQHDSCDHHWMCDQDHYCDAYHQCWDIHECCAWDDAVDGKCPLEMRPFKAHPP